MTNNSNTDNQDKGRSKAGGSRRKTTNSSKVTTQEEETMKASDKPEGAGGNQDTSQAGSDKTVDNAAEVEQSLSEDTGDTGIDDWAAAMAEQGVTEDTSTSAPEQPAAETPVSQSGADIFQPLEQDTGSQHDTRELSVVMDIPVKLNVVLGRTRITIKELLELSEGSVVELDGLAGDPLDILINDYLVAQGEVVVVDDKYGIRITDIVTPSERIHKLNR